MKWILFLILSFAITAKAQNRKIDILKQQLKAAQQDSGKVNILIELGKRLSYIDPDTALFYFQKSLDLSKKINFKSGEFYSMMLTGEVLATRGNYSKAQEFELQAFHEVSDLRNEDLIADGNMYLGNLYFYQGNYRHAMDYYDETKLVDKNDTAFYEAITGLKGRDFLELGMLDSAFANAKIAYDIELRRRPMTWILPAVTFAAILSKQGKLDSALNIYKMYKDFEPGSKANVEMTIPMTRILFIKNENDSAIYYLKKTITYAIAGAYIEDASEASKLLADVYTSEKNFDSAYTYLLLNSSLRDSLIYLNKDREIRNEEFDKKLHDNELQASRLKYQNELRIYWFGIAVLIFLVSTFLFWRNNKHKKNEFFLLQKQKHDEQLNLQNEFQQTLLKTQLEIQEQTLKNISQEIHDNIGQVLSLAKLNLGTVDMNDSLAVREKIDDSKDLISKAIQDLRDIAKSLDTDHIKVLGLAKSITHELEVIKKTGGFETIFEIEGEVYKLESQKELILFRIVQEVINNILRHAKAGIIVVKMKYEPDFFSLKIHDNGNGFDVNNLKKDSEASSGLGIKNMWDRAQIIGAHLAITSLVGEGTTVDIKLPIST